MDWLEALEALDRIIDAFERGHGGDLRLAIEATRKRRDSLKEYRWSRASGGTYVTNAYSADEARENILFQWTLGRDDADLPRVDRKIVQEIRRELAAEPLIRPLLRYPIDPSSLAVTHLCVH